MSQEEYYIGEFLIQIFANTQEYIRIYGFKPLYVAVDKYHYESIKRSPFAPWVDTDTMQLMNGVFIVLEDRFTGDFMSFRTQNYKPRKEQDN